MQLDAEMKKLLDEIKAHSRNREESAINLSFGTPSSQSRGRPRTEAEQSGENRTAFARDRDRLLYSKAFFRLSGKTQVFMSPRNPLISNRMTHSIHVAQLARAITRWLHLNEDLAEAIALGHDTGHSPFGHMGELVINSLSREHLGKPFLHNVQSLRVLDILEKGGMGLNLSYEVREGIIRHCGEVETGIFMVGEPSDDLNGTYTDEPSTLEGCVVKLCDRLAYVGKDIEDAAESGIINQGDIPPAISAILGKNNSEIIDTLVRDLVMNFHNDRKRFLENNEREPTKKEIGIRLSEPVLKALNSLIREFNYPRIYRSKASMGYSAQTENMLRSLFGTFLDELDEMRAPDNNQSTLHRFQEQNGENPLIKKSLGELEELTHSYEQTIINSARALIIRENLEVFNGSRSSILYFLGQMNEEYWVVTNNAQMVIDYITLMTDTVATAIFESLTIPRPMV
ncbi:MAG: dNTP triphosphohydrolase [Candidatus Thermoplasmatota archaeon]|nr:dNTP triphosphohydrolase [Euryarchaeota archaeon]MBU4070922.1 dNTP triphosphohydrolase [Candidatus Thermoplasmatota archaeon]MBU4144307.1 dNTP triphosphohydrolase [Candidatus Thermoplasmatota archaeon]MBU4592602.1 dNTP triphosphohydrolase [Candidatus Thermoplasmatota archaeon]